MFGVDQVFLMTHDMASDSFTLRWRVSDADDFVTLAWYFKTSPTSTESTLIATVGNVSSGPGSLTWDMSGLPSGTYYVSCVANDGLNSVTHRARGVLILNRPPSFVFTNPDGTGYVTPGTDFPTDVLGNAWDMSGPGDVDLISGFYPDSTTWTGGIFRSVSSNDDPYLLWLPSTPISASTYPRISFCMYLDDPQNRPLSLVINWYANGRWWWTPSIPVQEGWHVYSLAMSSYAGWSGAIERLRLDPVALANVVVAIDWVRVPLPNSAIFPIRWNDVDIDDDAMIAMEAFQGSWQGARMGVTQGIHEDDPADQFLWDVSFLPEGAYYLRAFIDDGINLPDTVDASFPLVISSGPLDPLVLTGTLTSPTVLTLSWSPPQGSVSSYRIYRSTTPHFLPTPSGLLATVPFCQSSYHAHLGNAAGNPGLNYFFRVTWVNTQQVESPPSNAVGEFDFDTAVPPAPGP